MPAFVLQLKVSVSVCLADTLWCESPPSDILPCSYIPTPSPESSTATFPSNLALPASLHQVGHRVGHPPSQPCNHPCKPASPFTHAPSWPPHLAPDPPRRPPADGHGTRRVGGVSIDPLGCCVGGRCPQSIGAAARKGLAGVAAWRDELAAPPVQGLPTDHEVCEFVSLFESTV